MGSGSKFFRVGDYGVKGKYTEGDLDQLAADYDPAKHEAPVVIGHPETNAPAYGWVESLKRAGSTLLAKFRQVVPAFADLVKAGRFKKRSVALIRTPEGKLRLRHVGFLGAQPPEIKGLADVAFRAGSGSVIEFSEGGETSRAGDRATRTIQALKDAKRWAPAFDEMKLASIFAELAKSETKIEFGEGGKKSTKTALEVLADFLMGLPEISVVKFTEVPGFKADPESITTLTAARARVAEREITLGEALTEVYTERVEFTETAGFPADPESIATLTAAQARVAEREITFGDALAEVYAGRAATRRLP